MSQAFLKTQLHYDPESGIFTWLPNRPHAKRSGGPAGVEASGYIQILVGGRAYLAHRLVWLYVHGEWPQHQIDHMNGVRSDNRLCNLRDVPAMVNHQNLRTTKNRTGFMGVGKSKRRFYASIQAEGKYHYLGHFPTAEQASVAYLEAKRRLHVGCTI
jgi:hypothetical protein